MKIVITGTGYVGLVTGVCLSEISHNVTCLDIQEEKIEMMKQGKSPIFEPGLEELLQKNYKLKRLEFTTNYVSAYKNANIIFIAVGTPEREDGSANLTYIYEVAKQISETVENDCIVVIKSTVPIGTNDKIQEFFNENKKYNVNIEVASNPEFLSQGSAIKDTFQASRIILGVESREAKETLCKLYEGFNRPIIITNRRSAEMIKYASNDFLALKISFVNEIANFCELVGANIEEVTKGMSYDPRIGDKFLKAGIGYGGSCFPKDTKALHWLANDNEFELKTIKATIEINQNQKYKLIRKAKKRFTSFKGLKIAILGLTFKPGTDDLREAPSIPNVRRLLEDGAIIYAYDPIGINNFKKIFPTGVIYVDNPEKALINSDAVFIFTEWDEIKNISLDTYERLMRTPIIFDGRNCYEISEAEQKKIEYYSIGRREVNNISNMAFKEAAIGL